MAMKVYKNFVIFLASCFILYGLPHPSLAESGFVDECIENPELCEEPEIQEEQNENTQLLEQEQTGSLFVEIVKVGLALLLVVGLIYAFLYFLRRKNKLGNRIKHLENIGGIAVGQNKSVQLVRLGNHLYLIGVGDDITLLQEIKDEKLIDEILQAMEEEVGEITVSNFLSTILPSQSREEDEQTKFRHLFKQELNKLQKNRKSIIGKNKEDQNE